MQFDFVLMIKRSIKVCISIHKYYCKVEQPRKLFKALICNFQVSKICKKGYLEMTKKNLPSALKKCPGSLHFTLLIVKSELASLPNKKSRKKCRNQHVSCVFHVDQQQIISSPREISSPCGLGRYRSNQYFRHTEAQPHACTSPTKLIWIITCKSRNKVS